MKDILVRIFVIIPIVAIEVILGLTMIIPLIYWIITGVSYMDLCFEIHEFLNDKFNL